MDSQCPFSSLFKSNDGDVLLFVIRREDMAHFLMAVAGVRASERDIVQDLMSSGLMSLRMNTSVLFSISMRPHKERMYI